MGINGIIWVFSNRVNTYNLWFNQLILTTKTESKREHLREYYLWNFCQINCKPGSVI